MRWHRFGFPRLWPRARRRAFRALRAAPLVLQLVVGAIVSVGLWARSQLGLPRAPQTDRVALSAEQYAHDQVDPDGDLHDQCAHELAHLLGRKLGPSLAARARRGQQRLQ